MTAFAIKTLQMPVGHGLYVTTVRDGSPAALAGLRVNDVILAFDGKQMSSTDDLKNALSSVKPGSPITAHIWRERKELDLTVQF